MHLSQRKIAARLGCSHAYIQKLIARGTISAGALNDRGRIDPLIALPEVLSAVDDAISCITGAAAEWLAELQSGGEHAQVKVAGTPKTKPVKPAAAKPKKRVSAPSHEADQPTPVTEHGEKQESIIEANRRDAISKANMREMKEAEARGTLVNAREVELEAFARARQLRDSILTIPDRVAPIIAAETDEHTVRQMLDAELRTVLRALAETEAVSG